MAFNARNKHLPGVKCQKQATFGRLTPETSSNLALNARIAQQGRFTRLIGAGMLSPWLYLICGPTGSLTFSSLLFTPFYNSLPQIPFTNHLNHSFPSPLHHSHPSSLPHKPHLPSKFKIISLPNPTLMAEPYTPPLLYKPLIPSLFSHNTTLSSSPWPNTSSSPISSIFFFLYYFLSSFA